MRSVFAAATLFFALAAALPASAATASSIPKGTYKIDPRHAQVLFMIRHMGLSTFYGRFGAVTGTLVADPAVPEQSTLDAQIDMNGISTHVPELDSELKDSVFDVAKYPAVTFKATKIAVTGDNTGTVSGDLTIKDVTRPVTLNVTFNGGRPSPIPFQPYRLGFDATATIHRADFGLTGYIWGGLVGDDVTIAIEAEFEKQ
ncbi:MAG TPA: YceI family protein [Rhizomicrobium sp.]|nr:YceI family protein [Rhizomicrobium sp.]